MNTDIPFQVYLLAFCLFVGALRLLQLQPVARLLVPLLSLALLAELAVPLHLFGANEVVGNHQVMNTYILIESLLLGVVYYRVLEEGRHRRAVLAFALVSAAAWMLDVVFLQGYFKFASHAYGVMLAGYTVMCLLYYKELLLNEQPRSPLTEIMFWITTGLFFFSIGMFLYVCAFVYIGYSPDPRYRLLFHNLTNILNAVLYCCFIIGFVSGRRSYD